MGANESQIVELNLKRAIILIRVVVNKLFFSDHRIAIFGLVIKRNHGKSLLELTYSNNIAIFETEKQLINDFEVLLGLCLLYQTDFLA